MSVCSDRAWRVLVSAADTNQAGSPLTPLRSPMRPPSPMPVSPPPDTAVLSRHCSICLDIIPSRCCPVYYYIYADTISLRHLAPAGLRDLRSINCVSLSLSLSLSLSSQGQRLGSKPQTPVDSPTLSLPRQSKRPTVTVLIPSMATPAEAKITRP